MESRGFFPHSKWKIYSNSKSIIWCKCKAKLMDTTVDGASNLSNTVSTWSWQQTIPTRANMSLWIFPINIAKSNRKIRQNDVVKSIQISKLSISRRVDVMKCLLLGISLPSKLIILFHRTKICQYNLNGVEIWNCNTFYLIPSADCCQLKRLRGERKSA